MADPNLTVNLHPLYLSCPVQPVACFVLLSRAKSKPIHYLQDTIGVLTYPQLQHGDVPQTTWASACTKMSRSNTGCWTCRIRHKKCDENVPICGACEIRDLPCHGYGEKPEWLDGGEAERKEVFRIKAAVKANLKRRRISKSSMASASPPTEITERASRKNGDLPALLLVGESSSEGELLTGQSHHLETSNTPNSSALPSKQASTALSIPQNHDIKSCDERQSSVSPHLQTLGEEMAAPSLLSLTIPSYREAELLMHYLDYVFPLQFRFHTPDLASGGRGWLLWLLVKTGPLHRAALSLSALHQYVLLGYVSGEQHAELIMYHAQALKDLHVFLRDIRDSGNLDDLSQQIGVLACGVSLISFEVDILRFSFRTQLTPFTQLFRGGGNDWKPHLNALVSLSSISNAQGAREITTRSVEAFEAGTHAMTDISHWQTAALRFLRPVVVWFDLLSCASTGAAPQMPYRALLEDNAVDLESVMGCQNWVMKAIGDLADLHAWKSHARQSGTLSMPHLVSRSREIELRLEQGLDSLDLPSSLSAEKLASPTFGLPFEKPRSSTSKLVTSIFATGALVYLHTIVSGALCALPEMQQAVSRTEIAIGRMLDPQMIRGLIWPICITACMAGPKQQQVFERALRMAIGSSRDFGNCETALQILEKCWRIRELDRNRECDWRTAMTEMGICVLLV